MEIIAKSIRCLYPEMVYYGEIVTDKGISITKRVASVDEARKLRDVLESKMIAYERTCKK